MYTTSGSQPDLEALLQKAHQGDAEALAAVLAQCQRQLVIIARSHMRRLGVQAEMEFEDLVQSACKSLLRCFRIGAYTVPDVKRLLALANAVMRNKVRMARRKQEQRARALGTPLTGQALTAALANRTSPQPDPARAAQSDDFVRAVLNQLSPQDRRILELAAQDRPDEEAAREVGLQPVAYRVPLSRLRAKLRVDPLVRKEDAPARPSPSQLHPE